MDLQSFCVQNRRKVHSFPFLRPTVQSTEKMGKSFQFGVPVSESTMENCLKNVDISCNAQITFQGITKNQDCHTKKSCFDHFNKFSHFTFSRVVGGFVGSKSQGGSASREPHQVWDVILGQLLDTTYQATMNNNAQQYFSIGEAVSQSIFGQFKNSKNLDFTSLLLTGPCDFFASKKPGNVQGSCDNHCQTSSVNTPGDEQVKFSKVPYNAQPLQVNMEKTEGVIETQHHTSKQSYADVAKAFVASRSESLHKTIPMSSLPQKNILVNQYSRRKNEKCIKKAVRLNGSCYSQPSYNHSSQNQLKKSPIPLNKGEEHSHSKFSRGKFEHLRHPCQPRQRVSNTQSMVPTKDMKDQDERKQRFDKFRNYNMREKERKNIDQQVREDIVYTCNMSEDTCQNWRCDHNRMSSVHRSRVGFGNQRREFRTNSCKQQTRLHSPPPARIIVYECVKVKQNVDYTPNTKISDISKVKEEHDEKLCNIEKSNTCDSLNSRGSGDTCSESSLSSSPASSTVVLSERQRVASECSLDSEDSSVVFERDDHDLDETDSDHELHSESGSDCSGESDSDEDCDEVDFCYVIPTQDINTTITGNMYPVPEKLKDINARWQKENSILPKSDRVPKKVHFPTADNLAKVHRMVHWLFAYREARRGRWEELGRDHCRFQLRIQRAEQDLSRILDPEHRRRIWNERMCNVDST